MGHRRLGTRRTFPAGAALFLFLALLNPVALREDREALPTVVALVVDKSASQTLGSIPVRYLNCWYPAQPCFSSPLIALIYVILATGGSTCLEPAGKTPRGQGVP